MALKAVHVHDIPNIDRVSENGALSTRSTIFTTRVKEEDEELNSGYKFPKFVVMGHRGCGMNILQSSEPRTKSIKENSILSFNAAAKIPVDFIEFDVQVTKDDFPIIFHDNFILTQHQGEIVERRVTDLTLDEFLSNGPQKESGNVAKPLLRKTKEGRIFEWKVEEDDSLCTLQDVFHKVDPTIGFNVELKFDNDLVYTEETLKHVVGAISQVVSEHAKDRTIVFSSFQPDAALLMRKLQDTYPVFFLTNGGSEIYKDVRRNSLDEATKVCIEGGLQGIVSEVKAIFRNPGAVKRIKDSRLSLITYGQLNNVPELVYVQRLLGVEGVIVDLVKEITEAVTDFTERVKNGEDLPLFSEEWKTQVESNFGFSKDELAFLMKLFIQA